MTQGFLQHCVFDLFGGVKIYVAYSAIHQGYIGFVNDNTQPIGIRKLFGPYTTAEECKKAVRNAFDNKVME